MPDPLYACRAYLGSLTVEQRDKTRRDSVKALRFAWPHRAGLRARVVVRANVAMLRDLQEVQQ